MKKNAHFVTAVALSLLMAVAVIAGCTKSDSAKDKPNGSVAPSSSVKPGDSAASNADTKTYDVTYFMPSIYLTSKVGTADNLGLLGWMKGKFGLNMTVQGPKDKFDQELQLLRTQNNLPDMYNIPNLSWLPDLAAKGQVKDLSKYYNDPQNYPNLAKIPKMYVGMGSIDKKVYTILGNYSLDPLNFEGEFNRWFMVQKQLLDQLGLKKPTTVAELMAFLEAVKTKQPTTETGSKLYGLGGKKEWLVPMADQMFGVDGFSAYATAGSVSIGAIMDKNGKFVPIWATQERYQSLKLLNEMSRKGYLDPEAFSQDNSVLTTKLANAQYAMMIGSYGEADAFFSPGTKKGTDAERWAWRDKYGPEVISNISADGYNSLGLAFYSPYPTSYVVINAKTPDAAVDKIMKWVDWKMTEEGMFSDYYEGWLDKSWKYDSNKKAIPYYEWWPNKDPKVDYALDSTAEVTKQPGGVYWTVHNPFNTLLGPKYQKLVFDKGTYRKINIWYDFVYGTSKNYNANKKASTMQTPLDQLTLDKNTVEIYAKMQTIYDRSWAKVVTAKTEAEFESSYKDMIGELLKTDVKGLSASVAEAWKKLLEQNPEMGKMPFTKSGTPIPEVANLVS